jgi:hypothetical protein
MATLATPHTGDLTDRRQQAKLDAFIHEFNNERPHDGEGGIESLVAKHGVSGRPLLVCRLFTARSIHLNEE